MSPRASWRMRLVALALAGLALGALAGSLPSPWPFIIMGGLLVATIGYLVHSQRELRRASQQLAEFTERMEREGWL